MFKVFMRLFAFSRVIKAREPNEVPSTGAGTSGTKLGQSELSPGLREDSSQNKQFASS